MLTALQLAVKEADVTPHEFVAWMERMDWSDEQAAKALDVGVNDIRGFKVGAVGLRKYLGICCQFEFLKYGKSPLMDVFRRIVKAVDDNKPKRGRPRKTA